MFIPIAEEPGSPRLVRGPVLASFLKPPSYEPIPELGEHNKEILQELLHYSLTEIDALYQGNVLYEKTD